MQAADTEARRARLRGVFRLWLGLAQMAGATVSFALLYMSGLTAETIAAALMTTALTLLSTRLYRKRA